MSNKNVTLTSQISMNIAKASIDYQFGPYESIAAAYTAMGDIITAGREFGIKTTTDGPVTRYVWTKDNGSASDYALVVPTFKTINGQSVTGSGNIAVSGAIVIAGVKSTGTLIEEGYDGDGSATNIFYYQDTGLLGLSTDDGVSYYGSWTNEEEYGEYDTSDTASGIFPYANRLYVIASTGEVKLGTDEDLEDISDGIDLTTAQQNALDSGITSTLVTYLQNLKNAGLTTTLVAELIRLKNMNITYSDTNNTLKLTEAGVGTTTYDLTGGSAVVTTYGTPTLSVVYGSNNIIGASGTTGTKPVISVSQTVYENGEEVTTNTYGSIEALTAAFATGDSIEFSYADEDVTFDSLDEGTGEIIAAANTDSSAYVVGINVGLVLNGQTASASVTITQSAPEDKLHITGLAYTSEIDDSNNCTVTPTLTVVDSSENTYTYSVAEYNTYTVEAFSFSCDGEDYGVTIDSATGVITYNRDTLISNLASGSHITTISIEITQESSSAVSEDYNLFDLSISDMTATLSFFGMRGSSSGGAIYPSKSSGRATVSIAVSPGDVYAFRLEEGKSPGYCYAWESTLPIIVESDGSAIKNTDTSVDWTNDTGTVIFTKLISGTSPAGYEKKMYMETSHGTVIYKAVGSAGYLTLDAFSAESTSVTYIKKLN